ncbi:tyrosine-type recombinase/integrase [Clostridioides difficile]|uniref:tyrosine-type recombinase/integrase n=1 Tax=Clostridioides difficile TaxID=1496 RepID=UPI000BB1E1AE|nr:tyrosine-type recombinase/integrase [Clostridioides difficile]PBE89725.1 integrase [Clostridioides difficile]
MDIIEGYIDYIKDKKKLSENTVASYFMDIKKYMEYINQKSIKLVDIVENDIISYLIKLEKDNVSIATIARMISSIKSFHDYLFLNHICTNNPAKDIKKPKIKKENINILTEEEIERLLNFPKLTTPKLIRDKAIFEVLYGTGIKVSELVEMNIEDIDLDIDYIYCNSCCKNQREIPLCDITKLYLEKYLKEARPKMAVEGEKSLFVSSLGQRFTRQGLWKVIKKYSNLANIDKNINPTMLRHSFAIHLLNEGANIAVVSKILGNVNLSSLQVYLNHIDKNVRREIKEKHPRNDVDVELQKAEAK